MILFTILLLILILLTVFTVLAISIGGSVAIVLFGDVFVCIFIITFVFMELSKLNSKFLYNKCFQLSLYVQNS
jgi:hypothetical protein